MYPAETSQSVWKFARLFSLTFAVSVKIEDTARSHHGFQRDDLIERHPE